MPLSLSLAVLLSMVEVRGEGTCPAPAEVMAAQQALGATGQTDWVAELEETATGLQLRLLGADGALLASRELQTHAPCPQRATAAAVVLSAWEAELAAAQAPAEVLPPPPQWKLRLGAEAQVGVTTHSGARWMPALALVGHFSLGESPLSGVARLTTALPASSPLGTADAVWMRPMVSLEAGPSLRLGDAFGEWRAELTCGAALVRVWGEGFAVDDSSTGLDVSLSPALRWVGSGEALRPTAAVGAVFWLVPQRVSVSGAAARVLPQWEARASAGVSWGR